MSAKKGKTAMEMTDRKKKVLRSIVDLYIRTAEPVGSKAIAELPDMNYSSATIRNEMADLTTMGYLEQPHTSAGRIPSAAGYRLYVDELMAEYRLSMDEAHSINMAIEEKMQRVDKMVERVAKLVSQATDLPAISVASRQGGAKVKRYELILAGSGSFILVLMLSNEEVVNKLIKLPLNVGENELKLLCALLNATMTDLYPEEFTGALMERVMASAGAAASRRWASCSALYFSSKGLTSGVSSTTSSTTSSVTFSFFCFSFFATVFPPIYSSVLTGSWGCSGLANILDRLSAK